MNKIDFFIDLGFTEYEAKVLVSLVKLKIATPKQISLDSNVPQNKLYQILKKFVELGILALIPADSKKYELINIKTFINQKLKEKQEKLKQLNQISKNLEIIGNDEKQAVFSLIKGQRAIMNKLAEMNNTVRNEVLGVQRGWKYWAEGIRAMKKAIDRGVNVKLIGVVNKENLDRVLEWYKIGCKIRVYNPKFGDFPLRMGVFDSKYSRITMGKPEIQNSKDYITIWSDSRALINMLKRQFNEMWKNSETLDNWMKRNKIKETKSI